jgi:hypothetical protein
MKDVSNGWEFTPPVRLSILNPGHKDVVNRPESLFPIPRQQSVRMHLDPRVAALTWNEPLKEEGTIQFEATEGAVEFTYTFSNRTELTGFSSLRLFVSSPTNAEDIDLFVNTSKLSPTGQKLETVCIDVGYLQPDPQAERVKAVKLHKEGNKELDVYFAEGPHGRLRVSHRELDEKLTTPHWPRYTHKNYLLLEPKEIVEVVVELWPCGMIWEKGEKLRLTIAGSNLRAEGISRLPPCPTLNMEGSHIALHAGGKYESYLLVPFIPGAPMECQQ